MPTVSDGNILEQLLNSTKLLSGGSFKAPEIAGPEQQLYGIYGPAYAQALGAQAQDPHFGAATRSLMSTKAINEQEAYEAQLAATRDAQLRAQNTAANAGIDQTIIQNSPKDFYGAISRRQSSDGSYGGIFVDPVITMDANAYKMAGMDAENFNKVASGVGTLATAGYGFSGPDLTQRLRSVNESAVQLDAQGNPVLDENGVPKVNPNLTQVRTGYETPAVAVERYGKDQGMTVEQQMDLQRLINEGNISVARLRELAGQGKIKAEINPDDGTVSYTVTGTAEQLRGQGLNPPVPNPNAAAPTAGVAATQGGDPKAFFGKVSSKQGMRTHPISGKRTMHNGTDHPHPLGTPIPAEKDGYVVQVGPKRGFGPNTVVVRYDDGEEVLYGHNKSASVKPGQRITRGQAIGTVGSEGRSTGPHVHRQVIAAAKPKQEQKSQKQQQVAGTRTNSIDVIVARADRAGMGVQIDPKTNTVTITSTDGTKKRVYDMFGNVVG